MKLIKMAFFCCVFLLCNVCQAVEITSPFGWRLHPVLGEERFHTGLDLGYDYGAPIAAMKSGKVVYSDEWDGYGNCVIIDHGNDEYTLYGHCSSLVANYGTYVEQGEVIAYVGSTGLSTGPHLHLEWWKNGEYMNPLGLWDEQLSSDDLDNDNDDDNDEVDAEEADEEEIGNVKEVDGNSNYTEISEDVGNKE